MYYYEWNFKKYICHLLLWYYKYVLSFLSEMTSQLLTSQTGWTTTTRCVWSAGPAALWGGRFVEQTRTSWMSQLETVDMPAAPASHPTLRGGETTAIQAREPSASPQEKAPPKQGDLMRTVRQNLTTPQPLTTLPSPLAALTAPCAGRWWTATAGRMKRRTARCQCCWSPHTASSSSPGRCRKRGLCVWGGKSHG